MLCSSSDDINWFRPVELKSKHGRRGHIKEPLGNYITLLADRGNNLWPPFSASLFIALLFAAQYE